MDAKQFFSESEKVKDGFGGIQQASKIAKIGIGAFAAAGAAAATGLAALVVKTATMGDEVAKTSRKVGVGAETLSALRHAADLSGVSVGELNTGLRMLASNAFDTMRGVGEAKDAFAALNIEATDINGNIKGTNELLMEVAERFALMADGTTKTALAMDIFGRSGASLINLLNQGATGIRVMTREAKELGITFDQAAAEQAEMFIDSLTRIQGLVKGLAISIGVDLMKPMTVIVERMVEWGKANREIIATRINDVVWQFVQIIDQTARILPFLADAVGLVTKSFSGWALIIESGRFGMAKLLGRLQESRDAYRKALGVVDESNAAQEVWNEIAEESLKRIRDLASGIDKYRKALGELGGLIQPGALSPIPSPDEEGSPAQVLQENAEAMGSIWDEVLINMGQSHEDFFIDYMARLELIDEETNRIIDHEKELRTDAFEQFLNMNDIWIEKQGDGAVAVADRWSNIMNTMNGAIQDIQGGITDSIMVLFKGTEDFGRALQRIWGDVVNSILRGIINMFVQMAVQQAVMFVATKLGIIAEATTRMGVLAAETYGAAFASIAAIPIAGPGLAPAAAQAATLAMIGGSVQAAAQGATTGATIAAFAEGGLVTEPTIALVGEAGPELITPLRGGAPVSISFDGDIIFNTEADIEEFGEMLGEQVTNALKGTTF
tara:strand:+ start:2730 stop:4733 length:2004 start_codon:yes stop_codon:yes gene_type:complete